MDTIEEKLEGVGNDNQLIKSPKTFDEQMKIIKEKGFIIDDEESCIEFLKQANYYRVSAYFLPFRKRDGKYFSDINFQRIKRIYEFDGRLRGVLFNCIEKIELYLRTQLAYYSGHNHGALGYMNADIYNEKHNDEKFKNLIQVCIEENKRTLVVKHHNVKYNGKFPIWVIVEFFSMGMLSYFYADMLSVDQKHIAKALYETSVSCLKSWLRCITELINRCAHYSRLYYWSFPALPKMPKEMEVSGNRKLFSQILVLKLLYPDKDEWNNSFLVELKGI